MRPHSDMRPKLVQLPSVQLIGAQKAGTSAIADWLFEGGFHRPRVFDHEPWYYRKEVHFFDLEWRYNQGVEFYAKRFQTFEASGLDGTLTMDATPDTLPFAERVRSIYEAAGGNQEKTLKIIVILREPVARELSLYNHLAFDCRSLDASDRTEWHKQVTTAGGSIMSFDEFVREVSIPALGRETGPGQSSRHGLYVTHLRKWFDVFDRDQVLVLSYYELQNNPQRLLERIQQFLGRTIPGKIRRSNSNDSEKKVCLPSDEAKKGLSLVLTPHNEQLYKLLDEYPGPPMEQRPFPRFAD